MRCALARTSAASAVLASLLSAQPVAAMPQALAVLAGTDMRGGAGRLLGSYIGGLRNVNYVYAIPTGETSAMAGSFVLSSVPAGPVFLHVMGRDDDGPARCRIRISVNERVVCDGPNTFPQDEWALRRFAIPSGVLRAGANRVSFENRETEGVLGMPPWFQVALCAIAGPDYSLAPDPLTDFRFELPAALRPLPEPLPNGARPGFRYRGIKGWMWKPEQYLAEIPVLARFEMNFLMNCYAGMYDLEHYAWNSPSANRWWEDLPIGKRRAYEAVVRECGKHGIQFCFSMNPSLSTKRPIRYRSMQDVEALWKHYAWMQGLGVRLFDLHLDDITEGIDASGQAALVNELLRRLRARDPGVVMFFCPSVYGGDGSVPHERRYLETIARELDRDVYLMWSGDAAVVGRVTRRAAQSYREISGHRIVLMDNYPVNDATPTMHLGPLVGRDPDLCEVAEGYMSNPLGPQNEGNRLPMLTCADYAYNPRAYEPIRSIGQAILHLERGGEQRRLLRDLVEAYPGFVIFGTIRTSLNPVREQFQAVCALPHARYVAGAMVRYLEGLASRMDRAFPERYLPEKKILRDDIAFLKRAAKARYVVHGE
jgi:hypothetical protein